MHLHATSACGRTTARSSNYVDGWTRWQLPFGRVPGQLGDPGDRRDHRQPVLLLAGRLRVRAAAVPGRNAVLRDHAGTIMLPFHVVLVPQYILFTKLGWREHVPAADRAEVPRHRRVLRLPDGAVHPRHSRRSSTRPPASTAAGHWRIFDQVILPLMGPALATTAIFTFIWTWNDFFGPLIYLTDPEPTRSRSRCGRSSTRQSAATGGACSPCRSSR